MKMTIKMAFFSSMVLASMLSAPESRAQNIAVGPVTITSIGCGMAGPDGGAGGVCFLSITGSGAGPAGCSGTSIRWDPGTSPNGQIAVSQLTSAFLAGKPVTFVLNNACFSEWPIYPTIWYYSIG
jgi:hypothetical protein